MPRPMSTQALQDAIVDAYLAGERIPAIEERFSVHRSSIYWFLRKSGRVPNRASTRHQNDSTVDMIIDGLRELTKLQDRRIEELERENAALRKQARTAERVAARRAAAG